MLAIVCDACGRRATPPLTSRWTQVSAFPHKEASAETKHYCWACWQVAKLPPVGARPNDELGKMLQRAKDGKL